MAEPEYFRSTANLFLQHEVYRLGSIPGLRSQPHSPSRDFLILTWGPIIFRTSYAPETDRLFKVFLRCLNDAVSRAIRRTLTGSGEQLRLLEKTFACKVFSGQDLYDGLDENGIRDAFHDFKVSLALPVTDLPSRLRACVMVDDAVLSHLTSVVDMSAKVEKRADIDRCWVKVIEENFPGAQFGDRPYVPAGTDGAEDGGAYNGWTKVTLSALVEVFDGLRQKKSLIDYHHEGGIYLGESKWSIS